MSEGVHIYGLTINSYNHARDLENIQKTLIQGLEQSFDTERLTEALSRFGTAVSFLLAFKGIHISAIASGFVTIWLGLNTTQRNAELRMMKYGRETLANIAQYLRDNPGIEAMEVQLAFYVKDPHKGEKLRYPCSADYIVTKIKRNGVWITL